MSQHRRALVERDGGACWLCGYEIDFEITRQTHPFRATFDHVIPRSRGGGNGMANLKHAHARCNELRGDRDVTAGLLVVIREAFEHLRSVGFDDYPRT